MNYDGSRLTAMRAVAVLMLLSLAGCAPFPPQMIGQFNAGNDFIVLEEDGTLSWSELGGGRRQVGIGLVDKDEPYRVFVAVHSASIFRPRLTFSPDYTRVTVDWGEVSWGGGPAGRSTEYTRAAKP